MKSKPMQRAARVARGFMLIEALVAMLIFAFGVLGVVGLQASMTRAQTQSKVRADASLLAQRLIGTMWADSGNLAQYTTASCSSNTRCSQWATEVASLLPNGTATMSLATLVTDATTGQALSVETTITLYWTPPGDSQHKFTTISSVARNS